ncbi:MAG: hypothetical protein ACRD12_03950 [Acidimicrobiales bacterium]
MLLAAVAAIVPVSVHFADDPLLNLRRLDPQLTTPGATSDCGSPVRSLSIEPASTDLYDVARADACQDAARRRVAAGLALAAICIAVGLLGVVNARLPASASA